MDMDKSKSSSFWTRVAGVLSLLWGLWWVTQELPFSTHGVATEAKVTGFNVSSTSRRTFYRTKFELIAPLANTACTAESTSWPWTRPRVGDVVPVIYYSSVNGSLLCEPDSFQDRWVEPLLFVFAGAVFLIFGKS